MRRPLLVLVSVILALPGYGQKPDKAAQKALLREAPLKQRLAREWLNLAAISVAKGSKTTAAFALNHARPLEPEDRLRLESLDRRAKALAADAQPEDPAVTKKRAVVVRNVCRTLDELALLEVPEDDEERIEGWLWMAYVLDPGGGAKRARILRKLSDRAVAQGHLDRVRRVLDRAPSLDPQGAARDKYLPAMRAQAKRSRVKIRGDKHDMEAWVLLPRSWSEDRVWPVLVYLDGPEQDYLKAALDLRDLMEDRPYIVVVPFIRSNHKTLEPDWIPDAGEEVAPKSLLVEHDVPGVKAIMKEVRRAFKAEKTFAMSGFSVGAMLNYWWLFRRPQDLWAAAPASGHYSDRCSQMPVKPRGQGPAVRILVGAADVRGKFRRWPQNEAAIAALQKLGHRRVEYVKVENRAHERFTDKVFAFLDGVRK
ncbi:MAG: hypothetical protein VX913_10810 [Planctomycetota bacterium]|nr:hypothetical protein [Planctomycetota bacterium]